MIDNFHFLRSQEEGRFSSMKLQRKKVCFWVIDFLLSRCYINELKQSLNIGLWVIYFCIVGKDLLAQKPAGAKLKFYISNCFKHGQKQAEF